MTRKYLILLLAVFAFTACKHKDMVAQVGAIPITKKDIELRAKVSEVYYPNSGKDYVALAQLIQGYLDEQVLNQLGYKVDDAVLEAEAKRIDENTKAPDVLKKIKDVYGIDHKEYINNFVRVVYGERYLYNEVFLKVKDIHKAQFESAQNFIQEAVKNPDKFAELAEKQGLKSSKMKLSEKQGISPYDDKKLKRAGLERPEPAGMEQAKILIEKISGLKPGEVSPQIIEWQEGYQIVRFVDKEGDDYVVESVSVPKRDYDDWFWERASKVPVKIFDPKLKADLVKNVGWAGRLNFQ
jgi:hypothetical protein